MMARGYCDWLQRVAVHLRAARGIEHYDVPIGEGGGSFKRMWRLVSRRDVGRSHLSAEGRGAIRTLSVFRAFIQTQAYYIHNSSTIKVQETLMEDSGGEHSWTWKWMSVSHFDCLPDHFQVVKLYPWSSAAYIWVFNLLGACDAIKKK